MNEGDNDAKNPKPEEKSEEKPEIDVRDTELLDSANDESNQVLNERQQDEVKKSGKLKGSVTI